MSTEQSEAAPDKATAATSPAGKDAPGKGSMGEAAAAKDAPAKESATTDVPAKDTAPKDTAPKDTAAKGATALATPDDKPDSGKPDSDKPDSDRPDDGKPDGDKPDDGKPAAKPDDKSEAKPAKPADETAKPADQPDDKKPGVDKPGAEKPSAQKPGDEKPGDKVADKPAGDPFAAFAPEPEHAPGRWQRFRGAVSRAVSHEYTLACLGALLLAVIMTWPTLRYPQHTLPQDIWDPTLQAWQMAWSGHILLTDPAQLWNANAFYPERLSFAFSDTLLGYAPAGMLGEGPTAAILRYNIMFVLAHALATLGAYALVRQLGAGRTGAVVAAAAYTYAPWMLSQAGHLHIVSNGGMPLALAMLARGHGWSLRHGYRPERRSATWALAGWLVAAWQITLGFGIGLVFAYVIALIGVAAYAGLLWRKIRRRPGLGLRLTLTNLVGGVIFASMGALLSLTYFDVAHLHPEATRTVNDLRAFSPPPISFLIAPAESRIWGDLHETARAGVRWPAEMTLLPGYALYGLALAGLFFSIWKVRHRILLLLGVLVTGVLAMGTRFFDGTYTYLPLFETLPGWDGLRTPGRLMIWTTLLLGILAAGAVSAFVRRVTEVSAARVPPRPPGWLRLATFVPLVLVLVEGLNVTPHPIVPAQPAVMRTDPGPMLVLPSDLKIDQNVMLWSTSRFQPIVNGGSGFTPTRQAEVREITKTFPDQASIDYLREMGVKTVVLLRKDIVNTPWQAAADLSVDQLGITREDAADIIIFRL
ncbi:hypothetical protein WEI85_03605 [Actinomycetes bacterium KLBMP 9797]